MALQPPNEDNSALPAYPVGDAIGIGTFTYSLLTADTSFLLRIAFAYPVIYGVRIPREGRCKQMQSEGGKMCQLSIGNM